MLLLLSNVRQQRQADCLAACAQMVLTYLQVPVNYNQLLRKLGTTSAGASFSKLAWLRARGLFVMLGEDGNLDLFEQYLVVGLPVIVAIQTEWLLYWQGIASEHAVVVVGMDLGNELVYINDPEFSEAPQVVTLNEFEPAWTEMKRQYAIIGLVDVN